MTTPVLELFGRVNAALQRHSFAWANEAEFQAGVAEALERFGINAAREYSLGAAGRPDFFVAQGLRGVALELKVQGPAASVLRQLHGYACVDAVLGLVLVTASMRLRTPAEIAGKPARTIYLPRFS